jgi:hypothetical protein
MKTNSYSLRLLRCTVMFASILTVPATMAVTGSSTNAVPMQEMLQQHDNNGMGAGPGMMEMGGGTTGCPRMMDGTTGMGPGMMGGAGMVGGGPGMGNGMMGGMTGMGSHGMMGR